MSGYGGTYRGHVVDNVDPSGQNRLSVTVPDVGGTPMWAAPSDPSQVGQLPSVGDEVQVTFEGGDADHPVWQSSSAAPASTGGGGGGGYGGVYQATVVDNVDPGQGDRLQVSVPDVLGESPRGRARPRRAARPCRTSAARSRCSSRVATRNIPSGPPARSATGLPPADLAGPVRGRTLLKHR